MLATQNDAATWPARTAEFEAIFAQRTRDEWAAVFEGTDACVAPVLTFREAQHHPHVAARRSLTEVDGILQSGIAPRFSRTSQRAMAVPTAPGADTHDVFSTLGLTDAEIEAAMKKAP